MNQQEREKLERRWQEIAAELKELTVDREPPYDPPGSEREAALLEEQDEIEYELGLAAVSMSDKLKKRFAKTFKHLPAEWVFHGR
jgi:hypothetical protein